MSKSFLSYFFVFFSLYFIGFNSHQFILEKRGIITRESKPAIIQNFKLGFCWSVGMGMAFPSEGS